jgi:hypothetical protein
MAINRHDEAMAGFRALGAVGLLERFETDWSA